MNGRRQNRMRRDPLKHLKRRQRDFQDCLETIRCMVEMVGVDSAGSLFNPYTGEELAPADSTESSFFNALAHGGSCEEIVSNIATYHYLQQPRIAAQHYV